MSLRFGITNVQSEHLRCSDHGVLTMRILLTLIILLLCGSGIAQSREPLPAPVRSDQQTQGKSTEINKESTEDLRGTHEKPLIIDVLPASNADEIAKRKSEQEEERTTLDRWLTGASVALAFITFFLALYTAKLWYATKTLAEDAKRTADRQASEMLESLRIAKVSADAAMKTAHHMEIADRAYIKISHEPPGLVQTTSAADVLYAPNRTYEIQIEVRNIGNTPAEITQLSFTHTILPSNATLPVIPPYNSSPEGEAIKTIMYGSDAIFPSPSFVMTRDDAEAIGAGTKQLYVLGYADYVDHFGTCHRAGYARRYDPRARENNLSIVTQRGYNYDERRNSDKGND